MVSIDKLQCPDCLARSFKTDDAVLICSACGKKANIAGGKLFFSRPPEDAPVNQASNPRAKKNWTPLRRAQYRFLYSVLFQFPRDTRLCDLGAGPGQFNELYTKFKVHLAVDFYPYAETDVIADLEKPLPFREGVFDVVTSTNTFEHIYEVNRLVKECHRILRPGGFLIGSTPFLLGIHQAPYDFHRFTNFGLARLLEEAGFREVEITPLATVLDWYTVSERYFFQKLFDAIEARRQPFRAALYFLVKFAWNLEKFLKLILRPLLKLNDDVTHALGYGFKARKSLSPHLPENTTRVSLWG